MSYTMHCKNVKTGWKVNSVYHSNSSNSFINYSKCCLLNMVACPILLALLTESNTSFYE